MENAFNKSYVTSAGAFAVSDEFDTKYTFVPLSFFQSLTDNFGKASQIEINLKDKKNMQNKLYLSYNKNLEKHFTVKADTNKMKCCTKF
jgi:hypothetical protein